MRILFVPLESRKTNERTPSLIRVLSRRHEVIGIPREYQFNVWQFVCYTLRIYKFLLTSSRARQAHLFFVEHSHFALPLLPLVLILRKPLVVDNHGNSLDYFKAVKVPKFYEIIYRLVDRITYKFTCKIITVSENDKRGLEARGFKNIAVIPTAADFSLLKNISVNKEEARRSLGLDRTKKYLIYIGNRANPFNYEAALWINRKLAPAISERFKDVQILMTGRGPIPQNVHPIVRFTGFIPQIYKCIWASDIALAPMWRGSGIMTKVIDAMACGIPVVATEFCTVAIPQLIDGKNAMIAKTPQEFIEKTVYLLEHPEEAEKIATEGMKLIQEHYNWDKLEEALNQVLIEAK